MCFFSKCQFQLWGMWEKQNQFSNTDVGSVVFAVHWRHLILQSNDENETIDHNFQNFYLLIYTSRYVKQCRTNHRHLYVSFVTYNIKSFFLCIYFFDLLICNCLFTYPLLTITSSILVFHCHHQCIFLFWCLFFLVQPCHLFVLGVSAFILQVLEVKCMHNWAKVWWLTSPK